MRDARCEAVRGSGPPFFYCRSHMSPALGPYTCPRTPLDLRKEANRKEHDQATLWKLLPVNGALKIVFDYIVVSGQIEHTRIESRVGIRYYCGACCARRRISECKNNISVLI